MPEDKRDRAAQRPAGCAAGKAILHGVLGLIFLCTSLPRRYSAIVSPARAEKFSVDNNSDDEESRRMNTLSMLVAIGILLAFAGCRERPADTGGGSAEAQSTASVAPQSRKATQNIDPSKKFTSSSETASGLQALPVSGICSLENVRRASDNYSSKGDVANSWNVQRGELYRLFGFAINERDSAVPSAIRLLLVGKKVYSITAPTGFSRPDVAEARHVADFAHSGYETDAVFDDVEPGRYDVIAVRDDAGQTASCPTGQSITVR